MAQAEPTVWRAYCRESDHGQDFADAAVAGGYIAFGGEQSGRVTDYEDRKDFLASYSNRYPDGATRAQQIWRLQEEGRAGDWMLLPERDARRVHVGRLTDQGYAFVRGDPQCRFPHRFGVEWLGNATYEEARAVLGDGVTSQGALVTLNGEPHDVERLLGDAPRPVADRSEEKDRVYEDWANRARRTARLVRAAFDRAAHEYRLSGAVAGALCQLTWITLGKGGDPDPLGATVAATYWRRTKLPGLITAFELPEDVRTLDAAAEALQEREAGVSRELVLAGTGFTNLYNAYRNSALAWLEEHAGSVTPLLSDARSLDSDAAARRIAVRVERLPKIPLPSGNGGISAASLLTPVIACLDPRGRFPILNGAPHVQAMLRKASAAHATLPEQLEVLVRLIDPDVERRRDAFGLDMHGAGDAEFVPLPRPATSQPIRSQPTEGKDLPLKDAADIEAVYRGGTVVVRRRHNEMTNRLVDLCKGVFTVREGSLSDCMYDALIERYDEEGRNLLIEVKSGTERGVLRLAVGQLLDYRRGVERPEETDVAVLLPQRPDKDALAFLRHVGVRALWFSDDVLGAVVGDWTLAST